MECFQSAISANFASYAPIFFGVIYHGGYRKEDKHTPATF